MRIAESTQQGFSARGVMLMQVQVTIIYEIACRFPFILSRIAICVHK